MEQKGPRVGGVGGAGGIGYVTSLSKFVRLAPFDGHLIAKPAADRLPSLRYMHAHVFAASCATAPAT